MEPTDSHTTLLNHSLSTKIIAACLLSAIGLGLAGWIGSVSGLSGQERLGLQALIMSGMAVPGTWLFRTRYDRGFPHSIGIKKLRQGLLNFALGIGLLLGPLILALIVTVLGGWGKINFNANDTMLSQLFIGINIVFFFEALPEELIYRGYIYSNLNTKLKRWVSALITIGLFVLIPIMLAPIQKYILGMGIDLGGKNAVTISYAINMVFFGAFVQYLRILTGSIWTGVGFHLVFVYINRIIGLESTDLIQFTDITEETPVQIAFIAALLLVFIALLVYPRITKRKIGWNELQS